MENQTINIYNLYDHITYTHNTLDNCLILTWDDKNPVINNLMLNEEFF